MPDSEGLRTDHVDPQNEGLSPRAPNTGLPWSSRDVRRIRDTFERVTDGSSMSGDVAVFDSVSGDLRVSLAANLDSVWRPRLGREGIVRSYLAQRGWIVQLNCADAHTASVAGVFSSAKGFGSGLMPVVTEAANQARAVCLVWNSTPAPLQFLNMRTRQLTYPNWSVAQLGPVRVPASLGEKETQAIMVTAYDRLCRARLQPSSRADFAPVRREIDNSVADVYGVSAGVLADWRDRLEKEPTIAKRRPLRPRLAHRRSRVNWRIMRRRRP